MIPNTEALKLLKTETILAGYNNYDIYIYLYIPCTTDKTGVH